MSAKAPRTRSVSVTPIALTGAVSSGLTFGYFSGDAACSAISVAVLGSILTAILAKLIHFLISKRAAARWVVPIITTTTVAAVLGAQTYVDLRKETFIVAFGVSPPADVRNLWVDRSYAGGPGDTVTVMRFTANPATVDQLGAALGPSQDDQYDLDDYLAGKGNWTRVWDRQFSISMSHAPKAWKMPAPMAKPKLYRRGRDWNDRDSLQTTTILWDQATGEAFVMVTWG